MRKKIVITGLILLIAGVGLAAFSTTESYIEENTVDKWENIWPSRLNPPSNPENSTFWGRFMRSGYWFEFNLSFSGPVRVTVSVLEQVAQIMTPVFNQSGTYFSQKVSIGGNGTYQVDIKNEGSVPADIAPGSNVFAKENVTKQRTYYPYFTFGTLITLGGAAVLIYGALAKQRKLSRARKRG
jgi:hypothetical protein